MKLIISFMDGHTEMVSISSVEALNFIGSEVHIIDIWGVSRDLLFSDIRSIVIA